MLIESDGALFRGTDPYWPREIWSVDGQRWEPYKGVRPKPVGWGDLVTAEEAKEFMASLDG